MTTEPSRLKTLARWVLGVVLVFAGIGHLGGQRIEFRAQVPSWLPIAPDIVVVVSGLMELSLGLALIVASRRAAPFLGVIVSGFFIVIFPGNIAQFIEGKNAFGLNSDSERFVRLWFQPLLVIWALWSTGGWGWLRHRWGAERPSQ
jgi:uncharacterized membrane protein